MTEHFPYEVLLADIRGLGFTVPEPPSPDASRLDVLQALWEGAGLQAVETLTITAYREFADFEDFWTTALGAPSVGPTLAKMAPEHLAVLKDRISQRLPSDATGRVVYGARANAVKGRVT